MGPFLTWLLSIVGPLLSKALLEWLESLFRKASAGGVGWAAMGRPAQVVRTFAAAMDLHHAEGDRLRQERAGLAWYQLAPWWSLNREIRRHERRTALLARLRDSVYAAARDHREKITAEDEVDIKALGAFAE